MADQDALNLFRRILAEGKVCTCLCSQFCLRSLQGLTTIVTTVQVWVSIVDPLAKRLVRRGGLVLVNDKLSFPSEMHAEYFRQGAVSCQGLLASANGIFECRQGLLCRYQHHL